MLPGKVPTLASMVLVCNSARAEERPMRSCSISQGLFQGPGKLLPRQELAVPSADAASHPGSPGQQARLQVPGGATP